MRDSRRMRRMGRANKRGVIKGLGINLIPMMDVLTVLVFFLLFHSFNGSMPEAQILLPESSVETKPRETIAIVVSPETVMVRDEAVMSTDKLLDNSIGIVEEIQVRLEELARDIKGDKEITLLADKTIPFKALKKIMSTCTASGYGKISLAVIEKGENK
jgi:biopolymer transport protein TolR